MAKFNFLPRTFINVLDEKDPKFELLEIKITEPFEYHNDVGGSSEGCGECQLIIHKKNTNRYYSVDVEYYEELENGTPNVERAYVESDAILIENYKK